MAYATYEDVQARMSRTLSESELNICTNLLDDAAVIIDSTNTTKSDDIKKLVSIRMVIRALGDGVATGVPVGATQGSMSGLGYSSSWTLSSGAVGQLYIGKDERKLLGIGNLIGSYSPVQELVSETEETEEDEEEETTSS